MATHSSILAWKIPWTEETHRAIVHGVAKGSDTTEGINKNGNNMACGVWDPSPPTRA